MKVLVSAGDLSGDLLLSQIIQALKLEASTRDQSIEFIGLAGPLSEAQGVKLLVQSRDVAVVGLIEVFRHYPKLKVSLDLLKNKLREVDALLCVDFPDFNFRLAEEAHKLQVPVDYVVLPQVWAWRSGRLKVMKKWLRRAYPVLPFEEQLLHSQHISAKFCGHPLLDSLPEKVEEASIHKDRQKVLALLPGSRRSEIRNHLPIFLKAWERVKEDPHWSIPRAVWALPPGWKLEKAMGLLSLSDQQRLKSKLDSGEWTLSEHSHDLMKTAEFGWVASGTASLEAALLGLKHLVVYRLSPISVFFIKRFTSYFSPKANPNGFVALPNLLLGEENFPELLQDQLKPKRLAFESLEFFKSLEKQHRQKNAHKRLWKLLGPRGSAQRVARALAETYFAT